MVVFKNGKQEAIMSYSEHFDEFKSIDLDTKMYYNSRSVNHLLHLQLKILIANL